MKYLTLDCETTCLKLHPKELNGNPFAPINFLCCVGLLDYQGVYHHFNIQYDDEPYGEALTKIQEIINEHDCIIGFNLKFDVLWLSRYNISTREVLLLDTQVVEFIRRNQSNPFPSLHDTAISYGFSGKLDIIKTEYWDKGIDTNEVPLPILKEYLEQDVRETYNIFREQQRTQKQEQKSLIYLANQDLKTLIEIEQNGMVYDINRSIEEGNKLQEQVNEIDRHLRTMFSFPDFNPNSGDHISACLYGGSIKIPYREKYIFTYKDGRTTEKERWADKEIVFPRLITPLKGSELAKEGYYSTSADTLKELKCTGTAKKAVVLLLQRAKIEKLMSTYLLGIPKIYEKNGWENDIIHGQLNQCVAITGRLSSSKPNLQNMDGTIGYLFKSRYT